MSYESLRVDMFFFQCCEVVPTILPGGTVYDLVKNRLIIGQESLLLQGTQYPPPVLSCLSNSQQQNLAGNAFSSTIVLALVLSLLCSMDFKSDTDNECEENVMNMIAVLLNDFGS